VVVSSSEAEQEFEGWVTQYYQQIFSAVFHWLGNEEEAKDVTQETFVRAWTHRGSFRGEASVRSWLFAIARNACRNTFRTWSRRHRARTDPLDAPGEDDPPLQAADTELSALDRLEAAERAQLVRRALQELDPDFRIVVHLCDMEGWSYEEVAQTCDCPVGTVRSRLHRGRAMMKRRLQEWLK